MEFDITFRGVILFGLEIRFYSLLILSGLLLGMVLAQRLAKRFGEDPTHVTNIAILGAIFALIGARTYHVIDYWNYYGQDVSRIFAFRSGGIGIFGALIGAIIALVAYVWWVNRRAKQSGSKPIKTLRWLDIGAPSFLLGQAVGRWGNFFNQELFGGPTDLPWAIPIDAAYRPGQYLEETHFHPLFLYESLLSLLGVFILVWIGIRFGKKLKQGDLFILYLIWYPSERFLLEFLRLNNWKIGAIPTAQIVSVVLVSAAVMAFIWWRRAPFLDAKGGNSEVDSIPSATSRSSQKRSRQRN